MDPLQFVSPLICVSELPGRGRGCGKSCISLTQCVVHQSWHLKETSPLSSCLLFNLDSPYIFVRNMCEPWRVWCLRNLRVLSILVWCIRNKHKSQNGHFTVLPSWLVNDFRYIATSSIDMGTMLISENPIQVCGVLGSAEDARRELAKSVSSATLDDCFGLLVSLQTVKLIYRPSPLS